VVVSCVGSAIGGAGVVAMLNWGDLRSDVQLIAKQSDCSLQSALKATYSS
jgi:hypothetical protein